MNRLEAEEIAREKNFKYICDDLDEFSQVNKPKVNYRENFKSVNIDQVPAYNQCNLADKHMHKMLNNYTRRRMAGLKAQQVA